MIYHLFSSYCIYPLVFFEASEEVRVALCLVRGAFFIFLEDLRLLSFLANAAPVSFFKFGLRFLLSSDSTSSSSRNTKTIIKVSKHLNFMSKICIIVLHIVSSSVCFATYLNLHAYSFLEKSAQDPNRFRDLQSYFS